MNDISCLLGYQRRTHIIEHFLLIPASIKTKYGILSTLLLKAHWFANIMNRIGLLVLSTVYFRYGYNLSECADGYEQCVNKSATPIPCDMGYYYDTSVFPRTVVTEVNRK